MKKTWETLTGETLEWMVPALVLALWLYTPSPLKTSFSTLREGSSSGKARSVHENTCFEFFYLKKLISADDHSFI